MLALVHQQPPLCPVVYLGGIQLVRTSPSPFDLYFFVEIVGFHKIYSLESKKSREIFFAKLSCDFWSETNSRVSTVYWLISQVFPKER